MSCDKIQTTCSGGHKCIHFSSNCCYKNNTFVDLSDQSYDVEFIFVPKEYGGFNEDTRPDWERSRKGWADAKRWSKKQFRIYPGYNKPLPICRERRDETRGSRLKGYERLAKVCTKDFRDFFPPYIYAFESEKSSLTNFQSSSENIYLVKIGVPGHYTLGVLKIDPWSKSVDFEFFDPEGYEKYFPGRNQCLIKGRENDQNVDTLLLAAICAFIKHKTRGGGSNKLFNFMVVSSLNIQIMQQDEYCQTWVLMYIYFKYILNKDVDFVLWLQNLLHHTAFGGRAQRVFAQTALDVILEFGKWITNFPTQYLRLAPLRAPSTFDSWKPRICAMNLNMKELIQMVNDGTIDQFLEMNPYHLYDVNKLKPLHDTYLRDQISRKRNPNEMRMDKLRDLILEEIPIEYKNEDEMKEKKEKIKNYLKKMDRDPLEDLLTKIREPYRFGIQKKIGEGLLTKIKRSVTPRVSDDESESMDESDDERNRRQRQERQERQDRRNRADQKKWTSHPEPEGESMDEGDDEAISEDESKFAMSDEDDPGFAPRFAPFDPGFASGFASGLTTSEKNTRRRIGRKKDHQNGEEGSPSVSD